VLVDGGDDRIACRPQLEKDLETRGPPGTPTPAWRRAPERNRRLVAQLEALGHTVTIEKAAA
jgi:hypothetical protein